MPIVKTGSSPYINSCRIGIGAFLLLKSTSGKIFSSIFPNKRYCCLPNTSKRAYHEDLNCKHPARKNQ